jgi:hypothetical protein
MALRGEIVDFIRLDFLHQADEIGAVRQVAVVQKKTLVLGMHALVDGIHALGVEQRRTAFDAVYLIAFVKQQTGQIRPVLAGYSGNQRFLHISTYSLQANLVIGPAAAWHAPFNNVNVCETATEFQHGRSPMASFGNAELTKKLSKGYVASMKTVNIALKAHKQIAKLNKQDMAFIYEALEALKDWPEISGVKKFDRHAGLPLAYRAIQSLL